MSSGNFTELNLYALYHQGMTNFKAFKWLHKVWRSSSCNPWEQDFQVFLAWILILVISDEETMIPKACHFFFPEIPVALVHDITSPNSFFLQLNENTHCVLMICRACQGKNWSFICRGHSHLFFSGPLSDGLWLTSGNSTPQTSQAGLPAWLSTFTT